ncbi:MAG: monovalent cation/H+ antiporter complex subunit F [Archaeoglobaceae archaeon]|nr:monovalent cation/H+ antiporter complex subunit F [Archaeoglobaceae archaeon]MCX8152768.1 monovalent cation/H+ antiporter complex subunit F [Archaeoglobaceae archaeon]MDW8013475.1 monovalent cation/H+ antiporter complex subunit F [Archaeoglobaceae archaeon]
MIFVFLAAGILLSLTIVMCLYRLAVGPGVYNQIAAANAVGTKATVLLILVGFIMERPHFVDIALMYAILNFIGVIIVAKYLLRGKLCHPSI